MEDSKQLTKDNVQRWLNQGMSHAGIANYVGTSKTSVTRFIGDNPDLVQPSKGLTGTDGEPVRTEPTKFAGTDASSYYQQKRIQDLEDQNRELKLTLSDKERDLNKAKIDKDTLERKLETFEDRKALEIERIQLQNSADKTGGLNGIVDKVMANEKLSALGVALLAKAAGVTLDDTDTESPNQLASSNDPIISAYLKNFQETLESVDSEIAGKIVTVAKALAVPTSSAALNTLFEKVTNPQPST